MEAKLEKSEDHTLNPSGLEYFRIEQRYRTTRTVIRSTAWVAAIWVLGTLVQPLAGQNTAVSLAVSLLADVKFIFSVTLAGGAATWAIVERRLRYKKTEYLQNRIRVLEKQLDPNRTSSGLTQMGKTNPKDRSG